MRLVTPLRFVPGIVGLWIAARVAILAPDLLTPPAEADPRRIDDAVPSVAGGGGHPIKPNTDAGVPDGGTTIVPVIRSERIAGGLKRPGAAIRSRDIDPRGTARPSAYALRPAIGAGDGAMLRLSPAGIVAPAPATAVPITPVPITPAMAASGSATAPPPRPLPPLPSGNLLADAAPARATEGSRWSGEAYLFRRGDGGGAALAAGGQLGGSQAGGRVAWRIDPADRFAAVTRVATPLRGTRGAEVAAGVDWHPLPGRPLRVSVERRVAVGGDGRDAWSAYAAGGFWRPIGRGMVVDGYAQAGVVGARRRDLFADGALRAGTRHEIGRSRSLTVGGGVWGAAQPGVARLDVGPRVALGLPLAGTSVTAAAEWRVRVAGDAAPGTGLAITLAADF